MGERGSLELQMGKMIGTLSWMDCGGLPIGNMWFDWRNKDPDGFPVRRGLRDYNADSKVILINEQLTFCILKLRETITRLHGRR